MRYFMVAPAALVRPEVVISGSDARHISKVMRLKPGDRIGLLDGEGRAYEAEITDSGAARVSVKIAAELPAVAPGPVRLEVAQAFLKDKKMDELLRRLCELGMDDWRPFVSERSVARPPADRMGARRDRWRHIVHESAKQCRRAKLPQIHPCSSFDDVLAVGRSCARRFLFWEETVAEPLGVEAEGPVAAGDAIMIVLGPEGGFSAGEVERARREGFTIAGLGPRILRAETAALAACAIVQYRYGDMGPKIY